MLHLCRYFLPFPEDPDISVGPLPVKIVQVELTFQDIIHGVGMGIIDQDGDFALFCFLLSCRKGIEGFGLDPRKDLKSIIHQPEGSSSAGYSISPDIQAEAAIFSVE